VALQATSSRKPPSDERDFADAVRAAELARKEGVRRLKIAPQGSIAPLVSIHKTG